MVYNDSAPILLSPFFPTATQYPLILKTTAVSAIILAATATTLFCLAAPLPTVVICGGGSLLAFTIHLIGTSLLNNYSKQKNLFEHLAGELKNKEAEIIRAQSENSRLKQANDLKIDVSVMLEKEAELLCAQDEIVQLKQEAAERSVDDLMNDLDIDERAKKLIRRNVLTNNVFLLDWMLVMSDFFNNFITESERIRDELQSELTDPTPILTALDPNQEGRKSPQKRVRRTQTEAATKKMQEISTKLKDQRNALICFEEELLIAVKAASAHPELPNA